MNDSTILVNQPKCLCGTCKICKRRAAKKAYKQRHPDRFRAQKGRYVALPAMFAHPDRHKARVAVASAIKRGDLVRGACEICGEPKAQAHHRDYSKPLDVRWLCRQHHNEVHTGVLVLGDIDEFC